MSTHTSTDLIDGLLGLNPEGSTYEARHFREKVLNGTQASYEALFSPTISLDLDYRWLVAIYACQLSHAAELKNHYIAQAQDNEVAIDLIDAVSIGRVADIQDAQLAAALHYTQVLIEKPIEGDKSALEALQQAGISTPDIVALSQLIAFLSYQIRLVAGLKAMQTLEASA